MNAPELDLKENSTMEEKLAVIKSINEQKEKADNNISQLSQCESIIYDQLTLRSYNQKDDRNLLSLALDSTDELVPLLLEHFIKRREVLIEKVKQLIK